MDNVMNNAAMNQVDDLGTRLTALDPKGRAVRTTIDPDGKQWWVAKDVCDMLGYSNTRSAVKNHLDPDEWSKASFQTNGGLQPLITISESGVYVLIMKSDKPEAEPFNAWLKSMLFSDKRHPVASYMLHLATGEPIDKAMDMMSEILSESKEPKAIPTKKSLSEWMDDPDAAIEDMLKVKEERQVLNEVEEIIGEVYDLMIAARSIAERAHANLRKLRTMIDQQPWA